MKITVQTMKNAKYNMDVTDTQTVCSDPASGTAAALCLCLLFPLTPRCLLSLLRAGAGAEAAAVV
jgi:hypothetical protein